MRSNIRDLFSRAIAPVCADTFTGFTPFRVSSASSRVLVSTPKEKVSLIGKSPKLYEHSLYCEIDAVIREKKDIAEELDAFEIEIIEAVERSAGLPALSSFALLGTERTFDDSGQHTLGATKITFMATYDRRSAKQKQFHIPFKGGRIQ